MGQKMQLIVLGDEDKSIDTSIRVIISLTQFHSHTFTKIQQFVQVISCGKERTHLLTYNSNITYPLLVQSAKNMTSQFYHSEISSTTSISISNICLAISKLISNTQRLVYGRQKTSLLSKRKIMFIPATSQSQKNHHFQRVLTCTLRISEKLREACAKFPSKPLYCGHLELWSRPDEVLTRNTHFAKSGSRDCYLF